MGGEGEPEPSGERSLAIDSAALNGVDGRLCGDTDWPHSAAAATGACCCGLLGVERLLQEKSNGAEPTTTTVAAAAAAARCWRCSANNCNWSLAVVVVVDMDEPFLAPIECSDWCLPMALVGR